MIQTPSIKHGVRKRWWIIGILAFAGAIALIFITAPQPFANDPNLIMTRPPNAGVAPGSTLWTRVYWTFQNWRSRTSPNPATWMFNANPEKQRCSIQGLLNQAMQASGTTYLIEKEVVGGTVKFGHDKALRGDQWIAAFEHALQNDHPEWWSASAQKFRSENLVFLKYDKRTVLVLSPEAAKKYQDQHPKLNPIRTALLPE